MSTPTTSSHDQTPVGGAHEVLVLSPDDYVVTDSRSPDPGHDDRVQRATAARGSHTEDVGRRMRNYAFSMAVRTLCVIGFVLAFPHWYAWLLVPGAVLLPYVAVVLANAGREQRTPAALAQVPDAGATLPMVEGRGAAA